MPQIIFKGVKRNDVISISKSLAEKLSAVSDTPVDYFTMERPETEYFMDSKVVDMYPLVEVILFDRGKEIEKNMAQIIADDIKKCGYNEVEVYFTHIEKENYYEF